MIEFAVRLGYNAIRTVKGTILFMFRKQEVS